MVNKLGFSFHIIEQSKGNFVIGVNTSTHHGYFILFYFISFYFYFTLFILCPHLLHMEFPRVGVESELQLAA